MKFWLPKDGEKISIKILDEPPLSMNQHFIEPCIWDGLFDRPPCGDGLNKKTYLNVLHDGERKVMAMNPVMMRKLADLGQRLIDEMQSRLRIEAQRAVAAQFKRSKMHYGAKR